MIRAIRDRIGKGGTTKKREGDPEHPWEGILRAQCSSLRRLSLVMGGVLPVEMDGVGKDGLMRECIRRLEGVLYLPTRILMEGGVSGEASYRRRRRLVNRGRFARRIHNEGQTRVNRFISTGTLVTNASTSGTTPALIVPVVRR